MYKILFSLLLCIQTVQAQDIIAFRGQHDIFDEAAFIEFASYRQLNPVIFSANQVPEALAHIYRLSDEYELYGFSLGAQSVSKVLKTIKHTSPRLVVTIGAYKTVDVNFEKYNVNFINFFDASGAGNKSPGVHLIGVPHLKMQKKVNLIYSKTNF